MGAIMILCASVLSQEIRLSWFNTDFAWVATLTFSFGCVVVFVDSYNGVPLREELLLRYVYPVLLMMICVVLGRRNPTMLIKAIALAVGVTALFALSQAAAWDMGWRVRFMISPHDESIARVALYRPTGLNRTSFTLAYALCLGFPAALSLAIDERRWRSLWALVAVIIFLAGIVSLTRSALLGMVLSAMVIFLLGDHRRNFFKALSRILLVLCFVSISLIIIQYGMTRRGVTAAKRLTVFSADESASRRVGLFSATFLVFKDHPLGVGSSMPREVASDYVDELDWLSERQLRTVGEKGAHNHILNILASYGIFGGMLLVILFWTLFRWLAVLRRSGVPHLETIAKVGFAALIGGEANALFHNEGIFISDTSVFILFASIIIARQQYVLAHRVSS
jgi:O-antigen ligase